MSAELPIYNERQARFEPAPVVFRPASLLIRAELADLMAHIPGYPGTAEDLVGDAHEMGDFIKDYEPAVVADMLHLLARLLDNVRGVSS